MEIIKKYWGHALVGILTFIAVSDLPYFQSNPQVTTGDAEIPVQLDRDVQGTLRTLKMARNFRDWRSSGFTPRDVLANTIALKSEDAKLALCDTLDDLSEADLAVFESTLHSEKAAKNLPCSRELTKKIQNYWSHQTEVSDTALESKAHAPAMTVISREISKDSAREISSDALADGEFALVFEGQLDPLMTREILKDLDERSAKAIFMVPGQAARDNSDLMEMIVKTGNSAGSEGSEIRDLTMLAMNDAEESIVDGARAVDVATDAHNALFAFPLSSSNDVLETLVSAKGLKPLRADIDSNDWKTFNADRLTASVDSMISAHKKGIILLHSDLHQTAIALPAILNELASNHRKLVHFEIR